MEDGSTIRSTGFNFQEAPYSTGRRKNRRAPAGGISVDYQKEEVPYSVRGRKHCIAPDNVIQCLYYETDFWFVYLLSKEYRYFSSNCKIRVLTKTKIHKKVIFDIGIKKFFLCDFYVRFKDIVHMM